MGISIGIPIVGVLHQSIDLHVILIDISKIYTVGKWIENYFILLSAVF